MFHIRQRYHCQTQNVVLQDMDTAAGIVYCLRNFLCYGSTLFYFYFLEETL